MTGMKTYAGGCHCGQVRFEAGLDLASTISCNCSICQKSGTILAFAPASSFRLIQGAEALTDYQFGRKTIHHLFCSTCGVRSFGRGTRPDGTETVAVNVRCLDDVEVASLSPRAFDGRSL